MVSGLQRGHGGRQDGPPFRRPVATQACAPSRAASRSWNAVTVGLVKRE